MFDSWATSADSGIGPGYRELFLQQEVAIREAMQQDSSERHDKEHGLDGNDSETV
jgi:hypothetical protein